jgi:hypothetical protein
VEGEKPISWIKVTIAVVIAIVIIGVLIYLFSRAEAAQSGELQLLHDWAMLQLNAPEAPLLL